MMGFSGTEANLELGQSEVLKMKEAALPNTVWTQRSLQLIAVKAASWAGLTGLSGTREMGADQ